MSVYARLLERLSDGEWHSEDDLREITPFPREWMAELRYEGHEVEEDPPGEPRVRLRTTHALA